MPALIVATLLAVAMAIAAPLMLRWLPSPPEDPSVRFDELATPRFRIQLFATVLLSGTLSLAFTPPTLWPVWIPVVCLGSLLGLIDAHTTFLPLRLHYVSMALVGAGVALSAGLRGDPAVVAWAIGVATLATLGYGLIWRVSGGQLGFGDVRLAGLLGLAAGATSPTVALWCFLLGSFVGAAWAIVVRIRGRRAFAYGPSMLLGAPLALLLTAATG